MIIMEVLGSILVVLSLACFSQGWQWRAFMLNLLSNFIWTFVAVDAQLWGLLALQGALAIFNVRGLARWAEAVNRGD